MRDGRWEECEWDGDWEMGMGPEGVGVAMGGGQWLLGRNRDAEGGRDPGGGDGGWNGKWETRKAIRDRDGETG